MNGLPLLRQAPSPGFVRHLLPSEMLLQVYETERDSGRHVDSIVLMGIGEPLDNYDNVMRFLTLMNSEGDGNEPAAHFAFDLRRSPEDIRPRGA